MKKVQICIWVIVIIAVLVLIGGCVYNFVKAKTEESVHPEVTFNIENYGTIKMELYPEYAPNTVANLIKLVESGYYDNKVVYGKDEMCLYVGRNQDGEAENPTVSLIYDDIEEGSDADYEYSIFGEFVANGYDANTLRHEKGIVSLIRNNYGTSLSEESYNSGNAQLGIMMDDKSNNLNGVYAAFGRITEGIEILENIYNEAEIAVSESETTTDEDDESTIKTFATYPVITSATVDTHGIDYGIPEVQEAFDYESYIYEMMSSYYSY